MPLFHRVNFNAENPTPTINAFTISRENLAYTLPSANNIPIFLIPSLGNGGDLVPLAKEIFTIPSKNLPNNGKDLSPLTQKTFMEHPNSLTLENEENLIPLAQEVSPTLKPNRLFFAYLDPLITDEKTVTTYPSLEIKGAEIAEEIEKILSPFQPAFIVSNKYGCPLSYFVAKHLNKMKKENFLYVIDGATPDLAKDYLQNKPLQNTNELWENILNMANQCELQTDDLKAPELESLSKKPLMLRCKTLAKHIIAYQKPEIDSEKILDEKIACFEKLVEAASNHLNLIYNCEPSSCSQPISPNTSMEVILTAETKSTFGETCGWLQENINTNNSYYNPLENHLPELADDITKFLSHHFNNKEFIFRKQCEQLAFHLETLSKQKNTMINNSIISNIRASLYGEKIDPTQPNNDSTVPPKPIKEPLMSKSTNAFFRSHSMPVFDKIKKLNSSTNSEQLEKNTPTGRKVMVNA